MQTLKIQIGNEITEVEILGENHYRRIVDMSAALEMLEGTGWQPDGPQYEDWDRGRLAREVNAMLSRAIYEARR